MATKCICCGRESEGAGYCLQCYTLTLPQRRMRRQVHCTPTASLNAELHDPMDGEQLSDDRRSAIEDELTQQGENLSVALM